MDAETVRTMLLRNLGRAADDPVASHDMYDDDAVLEFPQSGSDSRASRTSVSGAAATRDR
jgi:hypothetical protein